MLHTSSQTLNFNAFILGLEEFFFAEPSFSNVQIILSSGYKNSAF